MAALGLRFLKESSPAFPVVQGDRSVGWHQRCRSRCQNPRIQLEGLIVADGTSGEPTGLAGRRSFLKRLAGWGGGVVAGALAVVPALRAFLSPLWRRPVRSEWVRLGEAALIEPGVPVRVDFAENVDDAWVASRELRNVWLLTEDGEKFTVFSGVCTHLGCSFRFEKDPDSYHTQGNVFHCPCHHAVFDGKTGAVLGGPAPRALDKLEVKVDDGFVYTRYRRFRVGVPEQVEA